MSRLDESQEALKLLEYPFDQYQRYRDIKVVLEHIQTKQKPSLNVLDVGGDLTGLSFLSNYTITTINTEGVAGVKLQGSGFELPFKDAAFDVIVTVDTLEHVTQNNRQAFITELLRLSKGFVVITGPFANGYNEAAEVIFDDFLVDVLNFNHRFLKEHLQNGLPDLDECSDWITQSAYCLTTIPSGYTHHWLPLMLIKHYLTRIPDHETTSKDLDILYNHHCYESDHRLPSYRQLVVASKPELSNTLEEIKQTFSAFGENMSLDLNGVTSLWKSLNWVKTLEAKDQKIQAHEQDIQALKAEVTQLKHLVSAYQSGKFMRLMRALQRIWQAVFS